MREPVEYLVPVTEPNLCKFVAGLGDLVAMRLGALCDRMLRALRSLQLNSFSRDALSGNAGCSIHYRARIR